MPVLTNLTLILKRKWVVTLPLLYHIADLVQHRLAGLVVKASASRAEGPGFESRLRRDFFGVESYQ